MPDRAARDFDGGPSRLGPFLTWLPPAYGAKVAGDWKIQNFFTSKTASPVRSTRSAHQSVPLRPPPPRCTVGTQSAVLAGFAYNGIIMVAIPEHTNLWLKGAWLVVSVCAMGLEMICLINTSFCVMFGPGLAARGASYSTVQPVARNVSRRSLGVPPAFPLAFRRSCGASSR